MSVPGLNGVGPEVAASIRLAQSAAPAAAPQTSGVPTPAKPPGENAAQAALNEFLSGPAPSDASIGLYSAAPAALAAEQLQQQTLAEIVQQDQGALAEIEKILNGALIIAARAGFVTDLQMLLQAVEAGASQEAAAFAGKLQAALQSAGVPSLSPGLAQNETGAVPPALVENLIAAAQSGDMAAGAVFAQAIRAQMEAAPAALPPGWLAALAAARGTLAPPDVAADPLLQAYQMSLLIGVKTTLNKLRKLRDDHMKILPILALDESELREDE